MEVSISNVINISVQEAGQSVGEYNPSNVCMYSSEVPGESFGELGYKLYVEPSEVATDFGSNSKTYKMANALFLQRPNILANRGYLCIIPLEQGTSEVQSVSFSGTPASGKFNLNFDGDVTGDINWDDSEAEIQTAIRSLAGLESAVVSGSMSLGFEVTFDGYDGNAPLMTVTGNTLQTSAPASITVTVAQVTPGVPMETFTEAYLRTKNLVQYTGVMATKFIPQADMLTAAAAVMADQKIAYFVSNDSADVAPAGKLDKLREAALSNGRGLYYGGTEEEALVWMAGYAGRGQSTNFNGSRTTQNMHLKQIAGSLADPSMTQTLLNQCKAAGVDCYPSIRGRAGIFCSGKNKFFDRVYNLVWFVGALQTAGFNYVANAGTKVEQTEEGIAGLVSAYSRVCEQAVTNSYVAPGEWTLAQTFGNLENFMENIRQLGWYIYTQPVAEQLPSAREDREAPLAQIAIKEAGAVDSSNVIVNVNA